MRRQKDQIEKEDKNPNKRRKLARGQELAINQSSSDVLMNNNNNNNNSNNIIEINNNNNMIDDIDTFVAQPPQLFNLKEYTFPEVKTIEDARKFNPLERQRAGFWFYVIQQGWQEIVADLINRPQDNRRFKNHFDLHDTAGNNALHYAVKYNHFELLKFLLNQYKAKYETLENRNKKNHKEIILYNPELFIDYPNMEHLTPLHLAVMYDRSECIQLLLDWGASPELESLKRVHAHYNGNGTMDTACRGAHLFGDYVRKYAAANSNAMHLAIVYDRWHLIDLLLSKHENREQLKASYQDLYKSGVNDIDRDGNTRFLYNVIHKREAFYSQYIDNPLVQIYEPNKAKRTALHYFVEQHNIPMIELYLAKSPEMLITQASSLVEIAINNNFSDIVIILLDSLVETWKSAGNNAPQYFDTLMPLYYFAKQNSLLNLDKYLEIFVSKWDYNLPKNHADLFEYAVTSCSADVVIFILNKFRDLLKHEKIKCFDESIVLAFAFQQNNLMLMNALIDEKCLFTLKYLHSNDQRDKLNSALANKNNDYSAAIKILYEYTPVEMLRFLSSQGSSHRALFKKLLKEPSSKEVYSYFLELKSSDPTFMPNVSSSSTRRTLSAEITGRSFLIDAMVKFNLEQVLLILDVFSPPVLWTIFHSKEFESNLKNFKLHSKVLDFPDVTSKRFLPSLLSHPGVADRHEILFHIENKMLESSSARIKMLENIPHVPKEVKKTEWKQAFFAAAKANDTSSASAPAQQPQQINRRLA